MQSRGLAALMLASVVLLAGCTGGLTGGTDEPAAGSGAGGVDGDASTVAVAGQGSVEAQPDAATLRLQVTASGDDPEAVRDGLSRNASAVREALLEYGLDADQLRTEGFHIRENRRARHEPDADVDPYRGFHRIEVDLDDPDAVGEVVDVAVESGPVQVERVTFGLSDERREQLRDEALQEAMTDARGEAETVAAAENLQVASAERIVTSRVNVERPRATVVKEAAATPAPGTSDGANTRVESDAVTVTASVQVVYNATGAGSA